jgi:hypothetical protein
MAVIATPETATRFSRPAGSPTAIATPADATVKTDDLTILDDMTVTDDMTVGATGSTSATLTIISQNADALTVGRQGATAPALKISSAAASSVTGVEVVSAAAASGVNVRAISSGTNENVTINAKGSGTITLGDVSTGAIALARAATVTGNVVATTASANALTAGRQGSTAPAFNVDASAATAATGLEVVSAAAAGGVSVRAISSGTDENLKINAKGSGTITIGDVSTGAIALSRGATVTGNVVATTASANALTAGRQGSTAPAFNVDASAATSATGVEIVAAAAAGGVALRAISSGTDENLTINAKGTGTIGIGSVSTGAVTITPATTVTGALTPTGGVVAAGGFSAAARTIHVGGIPAQVSTDGTDATPVNTEVYIGEVFVPANCTVTGVSIFQGSVSSGNLKVGLADSAGAVVATSGSTAASGTDAYQRVPFTGTYAAKGPATYYVLLIFDNGTARYNAHTFGDFGAAKQTGQVYATGFTTITPPTTFTTALAPIASLY